MKNNNCSNWAQPFAVLHKPFLFFLCYFWFIFNAQAQCNSDVFHRVFGTIAIRPSGATSPSAVIYGGFGNTSWSNCSVKNVGGLYIFLYFSQITFHETEKQRTFITNLGYINLAEFYLEKQLQ